MSKNAIQVMWHWYKSIYKTDEQVKEEFLIEKDVETNLTVAYKTGFTIDADAVEGSKLLPSQDVLHRIYSHNNYSTCAKCKYHFY